MLAGRGCFEGAQLGKFLLHRLAVSHKGRGGFHKAVKFVVGELVQLYDFLHSNDGEDVVAVLVVEFPIDLEQAGGAEGVEAVEHMLGLGAGRCIGRIVVEREVLFHRSPDVVYVMVVVIGLQIVVEGSAADAVVFDRNGAGLQNESDQVGSLTGIDDDIHGLLDGALEGELAFGHHRAVERQLRFAVQVNHV